MKYQNTRATNQSLFSILQKCLTEEELSHVLTTSVTNKLRKNYDIFREITVGLKLVGFWKGYLYVEYPRSSKSMRSIIREVRRAKS